MSAPVDAFVMRFRGDMWDVRPRRLWQRLFDWYRENGCPLDRMDNVLIDLRNCVDAFDRTVDGPVRFLWGCDPGCYQTTWINEESWKDVGLEIVMACSAFDWFVYCELDGDTATFTIHSA